MDFFLWSAAAAVCGVLLTIGGYVVKITLRITAAENKADLAASRADVAGINVAANSMRVEAVAKALSEHKESVAANYVSNRSLENLENRLVDAIGKLGDRLDRLFTAGRAVTN